MLAETTGHWYTQWYNELWITAIAIAVPIMLGIYLAKAVRMADYGWKLALIFGSISCASVVVVLGLASGNAPKLGIDLNGGVILIYEIASDPEQSEAERVTATDVVGPLRQRINPAGVSEIIVRPYGDRQIEIIVPEVDQLAIDQLKQKIVKAGFLRFRIVADPGSHDYLFALAQDPEHFGKRSIVDAGVEVGTWVRVGRESGEENKVRGLLPLRFDNLSYLFRDAATKKIIHYESQPGICQKCGGPPKPEFIHIPAEAYQRIQAARSMKEPSYTLTDWLAANGIEEVDVLMFADDGYNVEGGHLSSVRSSFDNTGNPAVNFSMTAGGSFLMSGLTGSFLPDSQTDHAYLLGIVLDDELLSAPAIRGNISDRGEITGRFTQPEVDFLVSILKAGRLPAALNKTPISENRIDPLLGKQTIKSGSYAIVVSLVLVLLFMAVYYRFAGIVACAAVAANIVLILGVMFLVRAAFTLPGLAGLVLTVGMSVDANVLIYERIREELGRGAALRMALRNGFDRATTTIVDANVTTLITAIVLYAIGTDQIRGFAVTLILGIVMSMYTAIFCSRAVFEIAERRRWITKLGMMRLLTNTKFDFMSKWKIAVAGSLILIVAGVVATGVRGKRIFDIDLAGGTAVHVVFQRPMPDEELRGHLADVLDGTNDRLQQIQNKLDAKLLKDKALRSALNDELGSALNDLSEEEILPLLQQQKYGKDFTPPSGKVDWSATSMEVDGQEANTWYNVNTSLQSVDYLKDVLREIFRDEQGKSLLASYSLDYVPESIVTAGPETAGSGTSTSQSPGESSNETQPAAGNTKQGDDAASGDATDQGGEEQPCGLSFVGPAESEGDESPDATTSDEGENSPEAVGAAKGPDANDATPSTDEDDSPDASTSTNGQEAPDATPRSNGQELPDTSSAADGQPSTADGVTSTDDRGGATSPPPEGPGTAPSEGPSTPSTPGATRNDFTSQVTVAFGHEIHGPALTEALRAAAAAQGIDDLVLRIRPEPPQPDWTETSNVGYVKWHLELGADKQQTMAILDAVKSDLSETPVWPSSNKIGGQVAGDTQAMAMAALLASLLGIIIYLWIRFQRVSFGLAAVVALVHDVSITVGAVAVSYWLKDILGFAQIIEFKISLPVVAALLTIIGYSLNDTIVVFDRIREVRGKSQQLTADMVNRSVNQTLSRTLLTSGTTLIVVAILYFFGGEGVHGFAFALLVGIVVGTYSSVFIASPVLVWLMNRKTATSKPAVKATV